MKLPLYLIFICLLCANLKASEVIHTFDSEITLHKDGTVQASERIELTSNAETVRHGITRELPNTVRVGWGRRVSLPLKVTRVVVDGHNMPIYTKQMDNNLSVVMGDALVDMPSGKHSFELQYILGQAVQASGDRDVLIWNTTGDRVSLPIERASVTMHLPGAVDTDKIKIDAITGSYHSRDHRVSIRRVDNRTLRFNTTRTLGSREMLIIELSWPHAVSVRQTGAGAAWGVVLLILLAAVTVSMAMYVVYTGLHHPKGSFTPDACTTPEGMSPAAARYLALGKNDAMGLVCCLIDMAVMGYIRIELHRTGFTIRRLDRDATDMDVEQRLVIDTLLADQTEYRVQRSYQPVVQRLLGEFTSCVRFGWRSAVKNRRILTTIVLCMGLSCVVSLISLFGPMNPMYVASYSLAWTAWSVLFGIRVLARWRRSSQWLGNVIYTVISGIVMLLPGLVVWAKLPDEFQLTMLCSTLLSISTLQLFCNKQPASSARCLFSTLTAYTQCLEEARAPVADQQHLSYAIALEVTRGWFSKHRTYINEGKVHVDWLVIPAESSRFDFARMADRMALDIAQSAVQPLTPSRNRLYELCEDASNKLEKPDSHK